MLVHEIQRCENVTVFIWRFTYSEHDSAYKMGDDGADDNNDLAIFMESRRGGVKLPRALRSLCVP